MSLIDGYENGVVGMKTGVPTMSQSLLAPYTNAVWKTTRISGHLSDKQVWPLSLYFMMFS